MKSFSVINLISYSITFVIRKATIITNKRCIGKRKLRILSNKDILLQKNKGDGFMRYTLITKRVRE